MTHPGLHPFLPTEIESVAGLDADIGRRNVLGVDSKTKCYEMLATELNR